jgi:hypothetical protein
MHASQDQLAEKELLEIKIVEMRIQSRGSDHIGQLTAMNNLARTYTKQKKYPHAPLSNLTSLHLMHLARAVGMGDATAKL